MICKDNQRIIDTLLRLKVGNDNNKIASYQHQYQDWKT